jgi:hypothetical protein
VVVKAAGEACCGQRWKTRKLVFKAGTEGEGLCLTTASLGLRGRGLTFDVRGSRKWAKPACGCPLDGGVRRLRDQSRNSLGFDGAVGALSLSVATAAESCCQVDSEKFSLAKMTDFGRWPVSRQATTIVSFWIRTALMSCNEIVFFSTFSIERMSDSEVIVTLSPPGLRRTTDKVVKVTPTTATPIETLGGRPIAKLKATKNTTSRSCLPAYIAVLRNERSTSNDWFIGGK